MLEKIELRKKLKNISLVNADYSTTVINRLQNIIKDKIVCTYIPLENEINNNMYLKGQSSLSTTCKKDGQIKICINEEPLEKNNFNVYQPSPGRNESKNWRISSKRTLSSRNPGGNSKNHKSCFWKKLNYLIL